ncbi:unnamed protein product [Prorocentrum cordatum]|uniref:Mei2-like C-terminal RNA recognition motif domain-containing protein n=1 Tax=Prorocentrum cordatum TaxID=2364126 RepID=A0ABN9TXD1_9DINO|nr:unnamed protein product [Polarella glacialis]
MAPVVARMNNDETNAIFRKTLLEFASDAKGCPSPGPGQTTQTNRSSWADLTDESDEDDFGLAGLPMSSGPHDLLQFQAWPSTATKAGTDCGVGQPCPSGPPKAAEGCLGEGGAAVANTRTPLSLGKMLALGRRGASVLERTPLSTKAAAFVPLPQSSLQPLPTVLAPPARWGRAPAQEEAAGGAPRAEGPEGGTVMMRNLPPCYTRQRLIDLLALHGFSQHCDFLYLPVNFELSQTVGYAFLNLASQAHLERFFRVFEGFSDWGVESEQVCNVCWSETQGREANIERYRNSPVMRDEVPDEFKPTLLVGGRPVALPRPTRQLRSLRSRKGQKLATAGAASAIAFQ